jgi:hypothetical protein
LFTACSDNGFALRRQSPNFTADEFLQMSFALDEEFPAHPRELVRPDFRHFQRECPDMLFAHEFDFDFGAHKFPFVNGKAGHALRTRLQVDS